MAELDPSIILQAGQINDPTRLATMAQEQFKAQEMGRAIQSENMLRKIMSQQGAFTPDGQVAPNALKQIVQFDPQAGFALAKQNREAQLDQYKLKASELANQLKQSELGQAKLSFMSDASAAAARAYDQALKENKSPVEAVTLATRARNEFLSKNGGQISEAEEKALMADPFDIDRVRIGASFSKDYSEQRDKDRDYDLRAKGEARQDRSETWRERYERANLQLDRERLNFEKNKPQVVGSGSYVYDPKTKGFYDPSSRVAEPYTGGLTPRKRNGGDNDDETVDRKMSFISRQVGADIDQPLTPGQLQAFRDAYIKTEGAKGANVGNLKVPGSNAFQQFPNKQAGLSAIDAQIKRDFGRGQVTIRQLVEGVPAGSTPHQAGAAPPARAAGGMSGEAIDFAAREGLALGGKVPPGFARNRSAQAAIETRMAELATSEGKNPRDYMATGAGIAADAGSLKSLQKQVDAITAFENTTLANGKAAMVAAVKAGGPETFRAWRKFVMEGRRQTNDPNVRALDIAVQTVASEYGKAIGGGANGSAALTDSARHEAQAMLSSADSPAVLGRAVDQMKIDMENRRKAYQAQLGDIKGRISGSVVAQGAAPSVSNW